MVARQKQFRCKKQFADARARLLAQEAGELSPVSGAFPADASPYFLRYMPTLPLDNIQPGHLPFVMEHIK